MISYVDERIAMHIESSWEDWIKIEGYIFRVN